MKTKIIYIGIISFLLGIFSCSNLMDKGPLDKISEEAVWKDLNLAEAYINNQYKVLPKIGWYDFVRSTQLSCFTDEAAHKYNYWGVTDYRNGAMTPSNTTSLDVWSYHYGYIKGCNEFLKNIDAIPAATDDDNAKKNRMKGEALALRAWSYLDLASRYGGVVLITEPFQLNDDFQRDRSSFDETVALVVKDLDDAAALLPDTYTDSKDWGRLTKGAAMGLKSRILLYAASPLFNKNNDITKWQAAAKAAKDVIDYANQTGLYGLYGDKNTYKDVFMSMQNNEMMIIRANDPVVDDGYFSYFQVVEGLGGGIDGNGYCGGWSTTMVSQNLVDAFEMSDGTAFDWNNPVEAANPYANRDPRLYVSVTTDGSTWVQDSIVQFWICEKSNNFTMSQYTNNDFSTPNGSFIADDNVYGRNSLANPQQRGNCPETRYIYRKSMDDKYDIDANQYPFPVSWIIMRYAEILLNYSEAAFESGNESEALTYLNKIRARVDMPPVNASGDELRQKIRHERQIELCLEGHRYFDARRWLIAEQEFSKPIYGISIVKDKNSDTKIYTPFKFQDRKFPNQYYFQPIPISEIQKSGIAQNDGY